MIPFTVLGTLVIATGLIAYCYCGYRCSRNKPKFLSNTWCKSHSKVKETKPILTDAAPNPAALSKVRDNLEKVGEMKLLGMDFF